MKKLVRKVRAKKMKLVLTHYVQMDTYEVPASVCKKGDKAIENYIDDNDLDPCKGDSRNWEVVAVDGLLT